MSNEIKRLTCIECPNGCLLSIETDDQGRVIRVSGNQCEKGDAYGRAEVEDPVRILTTTVLTEGPALKMLPVRTSAPIPRNRIPEAMKEVKKVRVKSTVRSGDVVRKNFLGLNIDLIATRNSTSVI